ncbi:MAG: AAA family ATPase [Lachnospiraceae bacterium]|nr:AAA family ATPase [Lachnospiraceae bacterium]
MSENKKYLVSKEETVRRIADSPYSIIARQIRTDNNEMSSDSVSVDHIPYLKDVEDSLKGVNPNYDRILIISRNKAVAVKAAKYVIDKKARQAAEQQAEIMNAAHQNLIAELSNVPGFEEDEDLDYGLDETWFSDDADNPWEFEEVEEDCGVSAASLENPTYCLELSSGGIMPNLFGNPYVSMIEAFADPLANGVGMIFTGLDGNDNTNTKIDAVLASGITQKAICITPETYEDQRIKQLIVMNGFTPIFINDVPDAYYERYLKDLLDENGMTPANGTVGETVRYLRNKVGNDFSEEYLEIAVRRIYTGPACRKIAMEHAAASNSEKLPFDLKELIPDIKHEESALKELERMPGLEDVKKRFDEFLSIKKMCLTNRKLTGLHNNMIFFGNPGTGKTTCAKLLARAMREIGVSGGVCVSATRTDIVGKFVGHTAPKVENLFNKARGGILFVDEAGFFLNEAAGGYVDEALKEFVRFMEEYPDVTVVFAMYEKEAQELLKLDEGLSSRFSVMVNFKDYDDEELLDIYDLIIENYGFKPEKASHETLSKYLALLRADTNFGNAREARKIAESAVVAHCKRVASKASGKKHDMITADDVKAGIARIYRKPTEKRRVVGFNTEDPVNKVTFI